MGGVDTEVLDTTVRTDIRTDTIANATYALHLPRHVLHRFSDLLDIHQSIKIV